MVTARTAQKRLLSFRAILAITVAAVALAFPKTARAAADAPTPADIASAVWGYSGRSLTGFDTLVRDTWLYVSRILTGTSSKSIDMTKITQPDKEARLTMEELVNQPVIQTSLVETPELGVKLDNSQQVLSQLYIDHQYVTSQVGLLALKWNSLNADQLTPKIVELNKLLGDANDKQMTGSLLGEMGWLKTGWGWPEAENMYAQAKSVKNSLTAVQSLLGTRGKGPMAYQELTSALKGLETAEKLMGESTDPAGQHTAYGRLAEVQNLASTWDEKKEKLDKLLAGWQTSQTEVVKTQTDGIYQQVMVINRVPKAEAALASIVKDASEEKKLKNRILGLRGLVDANKLLLALDTGAYVANTWLEEGSIVFKTLVTNSSALVSQQVPLKYYLPPEVKLEDIIDHDGVVTIKYDSEKGQVYAQGELTLGPGESQTVAVQVDNVWEITQPQIDSLRQQVAELSKPLAETTYFAQGVTLASDINVSLDKVVSLQEAAVTPQQKIKAYREATIEMAATSEKLAKLQELVTQAGSASSWFGFVGGAQVMAMWGLIIIVVAGLIFLTLYMRTIASAQVSKITVQETYAQVGSYKDLFSFPKPVVHRKPRPLWQAAVHLLLFGAISSATTGVVVWQVMLLASSPEVASQPAVLASVTQTPKADANADAGTGGPDIIRIEVPSGGAVNLRQEPNMTAKVLAKLNFTQEAIRLDQTADWTQVEMGDKQGWVNNDYILDASTDEAHR